MGEIKATIEPTESNEERTFTYGQLLALVDALTSGNLNDDQRQIVLAFRTGILAFLAQIAEVP